jgi:hypothetical protein
MSPQCTGHLQSMSGVASSLLPQRSNMMERIVDKLLQQSGESGGNAVTTDARTMAREKW